ncbi:MAG: hypothetical protein IKS56_04000 [Lachnospiraceae bacterium]|nr:hypothetical protein [Lachnospiraceae bacterium]
MDNFISILRDSNSPEELEELKVQLYRENVRIKTDRADLEELRESVFKEKEELEESMARLEEGRRQFEQEADEINARIEKSRKNLEEDINDYNIRKGLLEDEIKKLDDDRLKLNREKAEFQNLKNRSNTLRKVPQLEYRQGIFFKGITDEKALKKRYKDLVKVFHPDTDAGDTYTLQNITREYETLLHDIQMKA